MLIKLRGCYKIARDARHRHIRTTVETMTDTLLLVHVLFRHGDRTPDRAAVYPTDPHKDYKYHPYGYGQLTNDGKRRVYRFGQNLRKRYESLLDEQYTPGVVDAWSSDYDRTKVTLQLVLAALFPPKQELVWKDDLPWQPLPFNYVPKDNDKMFLAFYINKRAVGEYNEYLRGPGKKLLDQHKDVIDYVEKQSGMIIENPRVMLSLACTFTAQEGLGLKLPDWAAKVWPDAMEEVAMKEFEITAATTSLKAITIGKLLQKIIADSKSQVKGSSTNKIHLYSCHDYTIGMLLKSFNAFDKRHPGYCSNIAIELHKIDEIYGFKIKYQCYEDDEIKLLKIPNVGDFWPLDDFISVHKELTEYDGFSNGY